MKKFLYIAAMALLLASCTEDFKDWAEPQSNPQGTAVAFGNGSVSPVGVIDFAKVETEYVKVADIVAPTTTDENYTPSYIIYLNGQGFIMGEDGTVSAELLENFVLMTLGQAPVQRDLEAQVMCMMSNGAMSTKIMSEPFVVSVIPDAPVISSAYYYVGQSNGWTACDASFKLDNGGGDVYANPVFTVTVPAVYGDDGVRQDNWFKIYSQETMDLGADAFWSGDFIGYAENGANDLTGTFVQGPNDQVAFAFMIPGSIEADRYRLTFNMLTGEFTIEPVIDLGTPDLWYLVGACIGDGSWGNGAGNEGVALTPLYPDPDNYSMLTYVGYFPAGQGFKLIHTPGSWGEQWGMGSNGLVKNDGGSSDIKLEADGYYKITYDLVADAVIIEKYTGNVGVYSSINMPGDYQGWNAGGDPMNPMTTIVENHDWILKGVTYTGANLKFAANGSWDVNWGAESFPVGIGVQNGANIPVEAGTYDIIFNDILGKYYFIAK